MAAVRSLSFLPSKRGSASQAATLGLAPSLWGPLTQAAVPGKEYPEGFALLMPVSAGSAVAPGCHARARVVHVVGCDRGAWGTPKAGSSPHTGKGIPWRAPADARIPTMRTHQARVGTQATGALVTQATVLGAGGRRAGGLEGQEAGPAQGSGGR